MAMRRFLHFPAPIAPGWMGWVDGGRAGGRRKKWHFYTAGVGSALPLSSRLSVRSSIVFDVADPAV